MVTTLLSALTLQAGVVDQATDLIAEFEAYRAVPYMDAGELAIGYGSHDPALVSKGWISEAEAKEALKARVQEELDWVNELLPGLTVGQQIAVTSLVYNIGRGRFKRSQAYRELKAGKMLRAINEMVEFNKSGGRVLDGLVERREREKEFFLTVT